MRNVIKLGLIAVFTIAALSVSAQQKPTKLGHINAQALIQAMPETAAAVKTLEAKGLEMDKEMKSLQEQFQAKLTEFTEKRETYSPTIRASKEQELGQLQERINLFRSSAGEEMEKAQKEAMQPIIEKVMNALETVGKENSFTYIFDTSYGTIPYVSEDAIDVTPMVKKKLGIAQ